MNSDGIRSKLTKEQIHAELIDRIYEGRYKSGQRLKEADLAREFYTSRTPIREVLQQLSKVGLIKVIPNKGAIVVGISHDDVEEIYEIRKNLEILALRFAMPMIRLQDLSELRQRVQALDTGATSEEHSELDNDLHMYIVECSHRNYLKELLSQLYQLIQRFRLVAFQDPQGVERAKREHLELINAIFMRDYEKANEVLAEHLEKSKVIVLSYLFNK